ncbi:FMN-binding protein [Proteiniclasticum sp. C24MP]|uniref:FMN-binding protein n=1 Tax=Proteiniclasticum sp. C24MP TaxID=3374101 RepID=UPI003754AAA5
MRKPIRLIIASMILFSILTGCQNTAEKPLQDGTYSVTFNRPDSTSWKAFMTLEILEGEITSVNYDYEGTGENLGKLKSEDVAYNEAMFATKGTNPVLYLKELENALLLHQDPDKVDTVSGATTSSRDFRTFSSAVLEAAREGNEEPIILEQPE